MTLPNFVTEYADYQLEKYSGRNIHESITNRVAENIFNILRNTECGLITINEGMKMLCNPFDGVCDKGGKENVR